MKIRLMVLAILLLHNPANVSADDLFVGDAAFRIDGGDVRICHNENGCKTFAEPKQEVCKSSEMMGILHTPEHFMGSSISDVQVGNYTNLYQRLKAEKDPDIFVWYFTCGKVAGNTYGFVCYDEENLTELDLSSESGDYSVEACGIVMEN